MLLALLLRVWLAVALPDPALRFDPADYHQRALDLLKQGLANWKYDIRAPGFIVFLAANYALGALARIGLVQLAQSVLGAVSVALVFGITQLTFARVARRKRNVLALLAGGIWAVQPDALFFTQALFSETLFVFVTLLGLYLLLRGYRTNNSSRYYIAGGAVMGMAALTREMSVPFVLAGVPFWLWWVSAPRRAAVRRIALYLGICLLVILPWAAHISLNAHRPELVSSQSSRDLWIYNQIAFEAKPNDQKLRAQSYKMPNGLPGAPQLLAVGNEIARQPVRWLAYKAGQVREVWADPMSAWQRFAIPFRMLSAQAYRAWQPWLNLSWFVLVALTCIGLVVTPDWKSSMLLVTYLVMALGMFFLTHYMTRFRMDLLPFVLPLTALGAVTTVEAGLAIARTHHLRADRRAWLSVSLVVLLALSILF